MRTALILTIAAMLLLVVVAGCSKENTAPPAGQNNAPSTSANGEPAEAAPVTDGSFVDDSDEVTIGEMV